jgi:very-short-patch-repair endonuclease
VHVLPGLAKRLCRNASTGTALPARPRIMGGVAYETVAERQQRQDRARRRAALQWGCLTRAQLRALGFSPSEIRTMSARGELLRMHRGVFSLGHRSPAPEARWAAALLAAGPGSALSHTAAAAARELMEPRGVTEVTAPTQRRGDAVLEVHHQQLDEDEVTSIRGLRVVTAGRMLLDLAGIGWPVDSLAQRVVGGGHASLDDLRAYADAKRGAAGARALNRALRQPRTRSRGEIRLLRFLRRHGMEPEMNAQIGRLQVDAYLPGMGLAIELDPEQTHGTARAAKDDAWRDRYLSARGITTLRIEERDFGALAAELAARARRS